MAVTLVANISLLKLTTDKIVVNIDQFLVMLRMFVQCFQCLTRNHILTRSFKVSNLDILLEASLK